MIRLTLMWLVIGWLCAYSIRDWFKPACALIVLMPLYGHPDMPTAMFGIQGLNPWNVLLAFVTFSFFAQKSREGLRWDLDTKATLLLMVYCAIMVISFWRLYTDESIRQYLSGGSIISEYFVNVFKRLAPAYFVFMGARTEERRRLVLWALFAAHLYIALMVFRRVPLSTITNGFELTQRALKVLEEVFSWSRVNVAMLLAGACWATLFSLGYLVRERFRLLPFMVFGLMSLALALTGGRTGWGVWAVLACLFSVTRWRKGLVLIPLVIVGVVTLLPSVTDRLLQGTGTEEGNLVVEDINEVTSGRTTAWAVALEKIAEKPLFGYGGEPMFRSGATEEVARLLSIPAGERGFPHPHNAYLLMLMDSGWIGATPVFLLWLMIVVRSIRVAKLGRPQAEPRSARDPRRRDVIPEQPPKDREAEVVGMVALSLILALLFAGIGSQDLFPVESTVGICAAIALMLRVHADRFPARERRPAPATARLARRVAPVAYGRTHAGRYTRG
jgi:O-antigen ligase